MNIQWLSTSVAGCTGRCFWENRNPQMVVGKQLVFAFAEVKTEVIVGDDVEPGPGVVGHLASQPNFIS